MVFYFFVIFTLLITNKLMAAPPVLDGIYGDLTCKINDPQDNSLSNKTYLEFRPHLTSKDLTVMRYFGGTNNPPKLPPALGEIVFSNSSIKFQNDSPNSVLEIFEPSKPYEKMVIDLGGSLYTSGGFFPKIDFAPNAKILKDLGHRNPLKNIDLFSCVGDIRVSVKKDKMAKRTCTLKATKGPDKDSKTFFVCFAGIIGNFDTSGLEPGLGFFKPNIEGQPNFDVKRNTEKACQSWCGN